MLYTEKSRSFEAILYTGDNESEVKEFLSRKIKSDNITVTRYSEEDECIVEYGFTVRYVPKDCFIWYNYRYLTVDILPKDIFYKIYAEVKHYE